MNVEQTFLRRLDGTRLLGVWLLGLILDHNTGTKHLQQVPFRCGEQRSASCLLRHFEAEVLDISARLGWYALTSRSNAEEYGCITLCQCFKNYS